MFVNLRPSEKRLLQLCLCLRNRFSDGLSLTNVPILSVISPSIDKHFRGNVQLSLKVIQHIVYNVFIIYNIFINFKKPKAFFSNKSN